MGSVIIQSDFKVCSGWHRSYSEHFQSKSFCLGQWSKPHSRDRVAALKSENSPSEPERFLPGLRFRVGVKMVGGRASPETTEAIQCAEWPYRAVLLFQR